MLVFCLAATVVVLPRSMWQQNLDEIRASALYVVNWVLAGNAVDYMAAQNTPSLAQHYWSSRPKSSSTWCGR